MTDKLLLDRYMGNALAEDYVAWAVELLVAGRDTPSLRVLAGLDPALERTDIEVYFLRCCKELKLRPVEPSENPREAAPLVRRLYRAGTLSPKETLQLMSTLFELSDRRDPLLGLWYALDIGHFALFDDGFSPEQSEFLDAWIDQEWELFDQTVELDLPMDFPDFHRCPSCGHIGPAYRHPFSPAFAFLGLSAPNTETGCMTSVFLCVPSVGNPTSSTWGMRTCKKTTSRACGEQAKSSEPPITCTAT